MVRHSEPSRIAHGSGYLMLARYIKDPTKQKSEHAKLNYYVKTTCCGENEHGQHYKIDGSFLSTKKH